MFIYEPPSLFFYEPLERVQLEGIKHDSRTVRTSRHIRTFLPCEAQMPFFPMCIVSVQQTLVTAVWNDVGFLLLLCCCCFFGCCYVFPVSFEGSVQVVCRPLNMLLEPDLRMSFTHCELSFLCARSRLAPAWSSAGQERYPSVTAEEGSHSVSNSAPFFFPKTFPSWKAVVCIFRRFVGSCDIFSGRHDFSRF